MMFQIRYVSEMDRAFWFSLDEHLSEQEFVRKIRDKQGYVMFHGKEPVGLMRYNLFWDRIPFLNLIYIKESHHGKGLGKQAMLLWENEMRELGHKMVMTSTQVDEGAQHFYRKLGYQDRGALFLDGTPFAQAQELFMIKALL